MEAGEGFSFLHAETGWSVLCIQKACVVRVYPEVEALDRLFPFQRDGVRFLAPRARGLLADEMGLGKTAQALCSLGSSGALVVCPASLKLVWRDEAAIWCPEKRFEALESGPRHFRTPGPNGIVATSYDSLPDWLVPEETGEVNRNGKAIKRAPVPLAAAAALRGVTLIVDEAHATKNYKAKRSKKVRTLARICSRTWMLTGTPLLNQPTDLFGVLEVGGMAWDLFGSWPNFLRLFNARKSQWGGYVFGEVEPEVPQLLKRVMLRRLREDVMPELPQKVYQTIDCGEPRTRTVRYLDEIEEELRDQYGDHFEEAWLEDRKLPPFERFSEVRRMLAEDRVSYAQEIADSHEEQGEPLVVFSAHRAPIDALARRERWKSITGDTEDEDRSKFVRAFQEGALAGIALTVQAGGVGLTLTRASRVLFVDLDWTPALNAQAEDRLVRIGQRASSVQVMRMVSSHPLDRRVHELLSRKTAIARAALGDRRAS